MNLIEPVNIFSDAWQKAALETEDFTSQIEAARRDVNAFAEFCFRDEKGKYIKQARHHREFQDLMELHKNTVMWYPVDHGKTTQAKIKFIWLLGTFPDRQYAYVSSKALQAQKVVGAISRAIVSNPRIKLVFPNLMPATGIVRRAPESWGISSIRVAGCPPESKDPSLAAYGRDGGILGSRLHGAIVDNILDRENTSSKLQRDKTIEIIDNEVYQRVFEDGFLHIIDTAWDEGDALHEVSRRPGWVSRKFDALDGINGQTLWPERFSMERLDDIRNNKIGPLAFDRMYRNRPLSESTVYFKEEFWNAAFGRCQVIDEWPESWDPKVELRTGVDLATGEAVSKDETSMSTVLASGHRRKLINMKSDRMEATGIIRAMIPIYRHIHHPINMGGGNAKFIVEDNAQQIYITQMLRSAGIMREMGLTNEEISNIRVSGRTTTAKKRDEEFGIQMIASGLEMGRWDVCNCEETKKLREEMRVWSPGPNHYGDRLMATWIAAADLKDAALDFRCDFL